MNGNGITYYAHYLDAFEYKTEHAPNFIRKLTCDNSIDCVALRYTHWCYHFEKKFLIAGQKNLNNLSFIKHVPRLKSGLSLNTKESIGMCLQLELFFSFSGALVVTSMAKANMTITLYLHSPSCHMPKIQAKKYGREKKTAFICCTVKSIWIWRLP